MTTTKIAVNEIAVKKANLKAQRKAVIEKARKSIFVDNVRYTNTDALRRAIGGMLSPGVWSTYEGGRLDEWFATLPSMPEVLITPKEGGEEDAFSISAVQAALGAMPFVYRALVDQAIAEYAGRKLVGLPAPLPVDDLRKFHTNFSLLRDWYAGRLGKAVSDWHEAVTRITVGQDAPMLDGAIPTAYLTVETTLDEKVADFIRALKVALRDGEPNSEAWAVVKWAGLWAEAQMPELDGWDEVLEDMEIDKTKVRTGIWRVNAAYRGLRRQMFLLDRLMATAEWNIRRIMRGGERPNSEGYAGGDEEVIQIGRVTYEFIADRTDEHGNRPVDQWTYVQWLIMEEKLSIHPMLEKLRLLNATCGKVFKLLGYEGAPVGFMAKKQGEAVTFEVFYTEEEYDEARRRAVLAWKRARETEAVTVTAEDKAFLDKLVADLMDEEK